MTPTIIQVVAVNVQYHNSENNKFITPNDSETVFESSIRIIMY